MFIIDRFEEGYAVIEHGDNTFNLPREILPPEAAEGDVLKFQVSIDKNATAGLMRNVRAMAEEVFEK